MTINSLEHLYHEYGITTEISVFHCYDKVFVFGKTFNEFTGERKIVNLSNN